MYALDDHASGIDVLLQESPANTDALKEHAVKKIGAIARPDDTVFTPDLPKMPSGKIMRRLFRAVADGKALGDTTTLADPAAVARLNEKYEEQKPARDAAPRWCHDADGVCPQPARFVTNSRESVPNAIDALRGPQ